MSLESSLMRTDDGNVVQFKWEPRRNNFASDQVGRPVFDQVLVAYVMSPGAKQSVAALNVCRKDSADVEHWNPQIRTRFQKQLAQWQSNAPVAGTPLEQLTILDVAQIAVLREVGIQTVEMLADVHDGNLSRLGMGARKWRDAAKAYLDASGGAAAVTKLAAELEQVRAELAAVKSPPVDDEPRRGRRRKVQEEEGEE